MGNRRTWALFDNGRATDLGQKRSVSPGTFPEHWGDYFIMRNEAEPRSMKSHNASQGRPTSLLSTMKHTAHHFAANVEREHVPWEKDKSEYQPCSGLWGCTKTIGKGVGKAIWRGLGGAQQAFDKAKETIESDPGFRKGATNSRKYFGVGAVIPALTVGATAAAIEAPEVAASLLSHPGLLREAGDFAQGLLDPGPPPQSLGGAGGYAVQEWANRRK